MHFHMTKVFVIQPQAWLFDRAAVRAFAEGALEAELITPGECDLGPESGRGGAKADQGGGQRGAQVGQGEGLVQKPGLSELLRL